MKLLLDTHILLWAAYAPDKIPPPLRRRLEDESSHLFYSPISLWEIAIKQNKSGSTLECYLPGFRTRLRNHPDYQELPVTSAHAVRIEDLPPIHSDPFDRMLIAQAQVEKMHLVTVDRMVMEYL